MIHNASFGTSDTQVSPHSEPVAAVIARDVNKVYGDTERGIHAISGLTFHIARGEFVSLFGPNGCGKSTLLNLIGGLDIEYEGEIEVFGRGPDPARVGFVFQNVEGSLFPWLSVLGNVTFGLKMSGVADDDRRAQGMAALEQVGLAGFASNFPYELSGGMMQKVSIARALAGDSRLLLLDEPFSALDHNTVVQMEMELIRIWEESPITTLLVSHDPEEAILLSDRIFILSSSPAVIVKEIVVPLPRPRSSDMVLHKEFIEVRSEIIRLGQNRGLFTR